MSKNAKIWFLIAVSLFVAVSWLATPLLFESCPVEDEHLPSYYTVFAVKEEGRLLQISDGTQFIIPHQNRGMIHDWRIGDPLDLFHKTHGEIQSGRLQVRNRRTKEKVSPLPISFPPPRGPQSYKITSISSDRKGITLHDGHFFTSQWISHEWKRGMAVFIVIDEDSCGEFTFYTPYFKDGLKVIPVN